MEKRVILITYALQAHGPVPSGLMLEGQAHLAGALTQEGYQARVLDYNNTHTIRRRAEVSRTESLREILEEIDENIQETKAGLVGFTLYTNGFKDSIHLAEQVRKRHPSIRIVAGGPLVSWFEDTLQNYTDAFDVLIRGKGDESIIKLAQWAQGKENLENIPGAIYRHNGKTRRNRRSQNTVRTLPYPNYDPDVYPYFRHKMHISTLRTSIGCRYSKCTFCVQPKIDGCYQERDIDDVLEEIDTLKARYGIKNFRLADPNPSPHQLRELFRGLPDDVRVSCFAYSDQEYDFSVAAKHLVGLFIGVESLDPHTLIELGKTDDPQRYKQECEEMIQEAKRHGIATVHANIIPVANDTLERIATERAHIGRIQPDFITALPLAPIPGTRLHAIAKRDGDASGIRLVPDYEMALMTYELDLLQESSNWKPLPWNLKVDGCFPEDLMQITAKHFTEPLAKENIHMTSDELVLMAYLYHQGLEQEQTKRREQVKHVQSLIRTAILQRDHRGLEMIVQRINA